MKAVIQRVLKASVTTELGFLVKIDRGILAFLGIEKGDTQNDANYILNKIINLRIFEDHLGKMNHSLLERKGALMLVSQFTLLADCHQGRRPSFTQAESPPQARELYDYLVGQAKISLPEVGQGLFGETMMIELVNDGPVTIILDSRKGYC
jgi:D-tyrosyl-tRNA(Tyr) deacylase